jgi:hypothetical protein
VPYRELDPGEVAAKILKKDEVFRRSAAPNASVKQCDSISPEGRIDLFLLAT